MINAVDSLWKIPPAFRMAAHQLFVLTMSLLFAIAGSRPACAQGDSQSPVATAINSSTTSDDSTLNRAAGGAAIVHAPAGDAPTEIEKSLFSSLFMAGKTQDQFKPLTAKERVEVYEKDLLSPFHLALAGVSAGLTQLQDTPKEWGLGAQGYGIRFANYYGEAVISDVLQMTGEDLLHEDNLYYGSGYHGVWKRMKYAVVSSVMARGSDGTQHFSISQVGSTAGSAFISRLWQPRSSDSAGDAATNFGINMATNAGINVVREFLPGITNHIFHHDR